MNIILCLPAIIMGRSFKDVMLIYFNQANEYKWLSMNFPNLYNFFDEHYMTINSPLVAKCGIAFTFLIFLSMLLYVIIKKVKITDKKILLLGLWSVVIATYFLPYMHERYMYVAELLSVIYFLCYFERFYIPISINLVSIIMYFYVLFDISLVHINDLAIIYLLFIIIFSVYVYKTVGYDDEVIKE